MAMHLSPRLRVLVFGLCIALFGAASLAWYHASRPARGGDAVGAELARVGIDPARRAAIEDLVHAYLVDHPEILAEASEALQAQAYAERLKPLRAALETPFPGAVLGNPAGAVTMVEFSDFACTYCRGAVADVDALIAANPDLKVVARELPIIDPASDPAARIGLAAAAQGRFAAYRAAMFAGPRPDSASIAAGARRAGVDWPAAQAFARRADVAREIEHNLVYARTLGIGGTPAFTIGHQVIVGAVGRERLQQAIDAARHE